MDTPVASSSPLAHRVKRLGRLDLPGSGQVVVQGRYAYLGHMEHPHGTTIVDVADPRRPRVVAEIKLERADEHSHKVRVAGDVMYTNVERPSRRHAAKALRYAQARAELEREHGRPATAAELAAKLKVTEPQLPQLEEWSRTGFPRGGFQVWNISDVTHQFQEHIEDTLVYCAWFSGGLRVVDIRDPAAPEEVAWFIPEPRGGAKSPQANDVEVDVRGLVYLVDRNCGFDILELEG